MCCEEVLGGGGGLKRGGGEGGGGGANKRFGNGLTRNDLRLWWALYLIRFYDSKCWSVLFPWKPIHYLFSIGVLSKMFCEDDSNLIWISWKRLLIPGGRGVFNRNIFIHVCRQMTSCHRQEGWRVHLALAISNANSFEGKKTISK